MTVIRPNSISGITSITAQANEINVFRSNGLIAGLNLNGVNFNTTAGISTLAALKVTGNLDVEGVLTYQDVTNVDSLGIGTFRTGINVSGGQLDVGSNIKLGNAGVITATSFVGSGAQLTGITQTTINNNADNRIITGSGTANTLNGEATFTYNSGTMFLSNSGGDAYIKLSRNASVSDGTAIGTIDFCNNTGNTTNARVAAYASGGSNVGGHLYFETRDPSNSTLSERLRIDSNGRLSFAGDTDTYIHHPQANQLAITLAGGSYPIVRFGTGGSGSTVGFSTDTTLVTNAERISVRGFSSFKSYSNVYAPIYTHNEGNTSGTYNPHLLWNAGGANRGGIGYMPNNGELIFNNQNAINFATGATHLNGTTRLRIGSSGEVSLRRGGISATPSFEIYGSGNHSDSEADNLRVHNWGNSDGDYWQIGVNSTLDGNGNNAKPSTSTKGAAIRLNAKNGKVTLITSPSSTSTQYEGLSQNENGIVTIPHQPAFRSYTTSDNNSNGVVSGIWKTGADDKRKFDNNDDFNESNGRFTAPVDGVYQISVAWDELHSSATIIDVQINGGGGALDLYSTEQRSAGTGWNSWFTSSIAKLASGDYVTINLRNTSGTYPFHQNNGRWGHYSIYLIG